MQKQNDDTTGQERAAFTTSGAKVLLVTNIPNPYRLPLFNELYRQLQAHGVSLKVIFGMHGYDRRKFQLDMTQCEFPYSILESAAIRYADAEKVSFTYKGLLGVIARERPDVIITNGFSIATMKIWARSWLRRTPFLIWSGAIRHAMDRLSLWREIQRRALVRRAAGCIAYGSLAKEYLVSLGVPPSKIEIGINTVDTDFFRMETNKLRTTAARGEGIKNLLCISYLQARKQVDQLLYIIERLSRLRSDFRVVILGDGPEMGSLQALAKQLGVERYVDFKGFVQKEHIPPYLAVTDCFLFPTNYDIWGLVLVEAMAAGAVCIASVNAGAVRDLIEDSVTGFAMDFSDSEAVASRVSWILDNVDAAGRLGQNARLYIENNASLTQSAQGFTRAIMTALASDGRNSRGGRSTLLLNARRPVD
jgi:glycosyltransferase involved in cell wall biosynthesis